MTPQAAGRAELRQQLLAGQPVVARRIDVNGVDTHVLEAGDGPPLVLLHGGIESGGVYWAPVITRLAGSHRLIVPDVPGLGESAPIGSMDAATLGGWLSELIRITCPSPPTLLAHSLLGTFAARFAAAHSRVLRQLLVCGAPGVGPYRMPLGLFVSAVRFGLHPTERSLIRFARWPFNDLDRTRQRDPEWFRLFFEYTVACARGRYCQRAMRQLLRRYTKRVPLTELQAITVPTALLWGANDRMVPLRIGQTAAAGLGWPLTTIQDAGHIAILEDPDRFTTAVHDTIEALTRDVR